MPYGIKKNPNDEWFAFNREYMPIGWNSTSHKDSIFKDDVYSEHPIYTKYKALTEKRLLSIAGDEKNVSRNEQGEITTLFLYNDRTNPMNESNCWNDYLGKIKQLSALKVKEPSFG